MPSSTPVAPLPQQTIVAEQQQTRVDRVVDGQNNLNLNLSHDDFYLPPKLRISRQRKLLSARDRSACLTVNGNIMMSKYFAFIEYDRFV